MKFLDCFGVFLLNLFYKRNIIYVGEYYIYYSILVF